MIIPDLSIPVTALYLPSLSCGVNNMVLNFIGPMLVQASYMTIAGQNMTLFPFYSASLKFLFTCLQQKSHIAREKRCKIQCVKEYPF